MGVIYDYVLTNKYVVLSVIVTVLWRTGLLGTLKTWFLDWWRFRAIRQLFAKSVVKNEREAYDRSLDLWHGSMDFGDVALRDRVQALATIVHCDGYRSFATAWREKWASQPEAKERSVAVFNKFRELLTLSQNPEPPFVAVTQFVRQLGALSFHSSPFDEIVVDASQGQAKTAEVETSERAEKAVNAILTGEVQLKPSSMRMRGLRPGSADVLDDDYLDGTEDSAARKDEATDRMFQKLMRKTELGQFDLRAEAEALGIDISEDDVTLPSAASMPNRGDGPGASETGGEGHGLGLGTSSSSSAGVDVTAPSSDEVDLDGMPGPGRRRTKVYEVEDDMGLVGPHHAELCARLAVLKLVARKSLASNRKADSRKLAADVKEWCAKALEFDARCGLALLTLGALHEQSGDYPQPDDLVIVPVPLGITLCDLIHCQALEQYAGWVAMAAPDHRLYPAVCHLVDPVNDTLRGTIKDLHISASRSEEDFNSFWESKKLSRGINASNKSFVRRIVDGS